MKVTGTTLLMLLFGLSSPTLAVTLITDQSTFLNSNSIVSTETFEDLSEAIFPGQSVTIDSVTYTDTEAPYWGIDNWYTTTSSWLFSNSSNVTKGLNFGKNQFVNAIGFSLIPFTSMIEKNFEFEFIVEEIDGTITKFSSVPKPSLENFFGFNSTVGIRSLKLFQPPEQGGRTNFAFDNVSRSAVKSTSASVPEPSSILGLLTLGALVGSQLKHKPKAD